MSLTSQCTDVQDKISKNNDENDNKNGENKGNKKTIGKWILPVIIVLVIGVVIVAVVVFLVKFFNIGSVFSFGSTMIKSRNSRNTPIFFNEIPSEMPSQNLEQSQQQILESEPEPQQPQRPEQPQIQQQQMLNPKINEEESNKQSEKEINNIIKKIEKMNYERFIEFNESLKEKGGREAEIVKQLIDSGRLDDVLNNLETTSQINKLKRDARLFLNFNENNTEDPGYIKIQKEIAELQNKMKL